MTSLHLYLAIGFGVVGVIVGAVIWSIRRMPSEEEVEEHCRRHREAAERRDATPGTSETGRDS
jgi:hypothetical protein